MWMPRAPRQSQVIDFLFQADLQPVNYSTEEDLKELGGATFFSKRIAIGSGTRDLDIAHRVLTSWAMLPRPHVDLYWPDRANRSGTSLAIGVRMYGGYWLNPCRVIEFTQAPRLEHSDVVSRITWKTIQGHCLAGWETFSISMDATGQVHYQISSAAAPMPWLRPFRSLVDKARQRFQQQTCQQFSKAFQRVAVSPIQAAQLAYPMQNCPAISK